MLMDRWLQQSNVTEKSTMAPNLGAIAFVLYAIIASKSSMEENMFKTIDRLDSLDFQQLKNSIDRSSSTGEVSLVAKKMKRFLSSLNDMHIEANDPWWNEQATICSEVACFLYDFLSSIALHCGADMHPIGVIENISILKKLNNTAPSSVVFAASYIIFDELEGVLSAVPDECEFCMESQDWGGDGTKVISYCGENAYIGYIPEHYTI